MNKISKWVKTLMGDDSINYAAQKAGVHQATLNRQLAVGKVSMEMIVALARGYEMSPITALLETDILTQDDVDRYRAELSLTEATDQQLVDEVARRIMRDDTDNSIYHQPITPPSTLYAVDNEDTMEDDDLEWAASPHEETEIPYAE